jgi:hypothetical protein
VTYDPNEFNAIFFPSMILSGVKIFLTPFAPRYHNLLFSFDREQSRFSDVKNKDCRRAMMIDKTYMTTSKIEKVSPGDILIFCRTTRRQRISAIGVVKSVKQMQNDDYGRRAMNDPMKLSEKRIDGRNKLKITFRHCFDLINGPNMKEMAKIYSVTSKKENVNSNSHSTSQVTLPLNHDVTENFETKSHFSIPQSIHPVSIEYLKSVIDFCGIDKKYFITL